MQKCKLMAIITMSTLMLMLPTAQAQIRGNAIVIDGDTIEIGAVRVRFFGIDAPEKRQACFRNNNQPYKCGIGSKRYLHGLIGSRSVYCEDLGQAKFGRRWGRCFASNINLQRAMVRAGQARAYRYHSDEYIVEQRAAKKMRAGMWQGAHVRPGKFRKCWRKGGAARECSR